MLRSFEYEFRSARDILDIQSVWQALGGYEWRAFDNDQTGIYIVAREAEQNLRLKLSGEKPDYTLEVHFDVEAKLADTMMEKLLREIFQTLLPAIDAVNVREPDVPFLSPVQHPFASSSDE
ncbi:MAG TPA: hypothetical protein VFP26_13990 [Gemmatimonadaceae bacterium]|nr:hypothetical protein [Gemmatimonadaceae bacterium]